MDLRGKVAVVTGGADRLGRAIVLALAGRGARVAVHYGRSAEAAARTVADARARGVEAAAVQADLADDAALRRIIPTARDLLGPVHVLVNSASIFERGGFADTSAEVWDRHFQINLKAPFLLSQDFAAQLPAGNTGKIINLGDWRGLRPGTDHFAYTMTKAALAALTQSLAQALAPHIQVNYLALGAILLPAAAGERLRERLVAATPARRLGDPQDVTSAVLFLLEGTDYITGETLIIDGGRSLV